MNLDTEQRSFSPLGALAKILRPLVKFALARRIPFQAVSDTLKWLYVLVSEENFSLPGKRMTDSRISVLTGLQRREIKVIRSQEEGREASSSSAGPLVRLIAVWRGTQDYQDKTGAPLTLPKIGPAPSFEALSGLVSQDKHPRTLLDDLLSLDLVALEDDAVTLTADAFIPKSDQEGLLDYLANNLEDHATAAVENVLSDEKKAPFFERAVHYNQLSAASLSELDALARQLQQKTLEQISAHALALQTQDRINPSATGRFRCGAFVFCESSQTETDEEGV